MILNFYGNIRSSFADQNILETVTWIVLVSSAYDSWLVAARKHPRAYPAMRLKQGVYLAKTGFKFEPGDNLTKISYHTYAYDVPFGQDLHDEPFLQKVSEKANR